MTFPRNIGNNGNYANNCNNVNYCNNANDCNAINCNNANKDVADFILQSPNWSNNQNNVIHSCGVPNI